jgi:hypothetical protein
VRYIQRQAADQHGRIVTVGRLILFGESEPIHIEETDTALVIGWKGRYRIDGPAFVYADKSGRVTHQHAVRIEPDLRRPVVIRTTCGRARSGRVRRVAGPVVRPSCRGALVEAEYA